MITAVTLVKFQRKGLLAVVCSSEVSSFLLVSVMTPRDQPEPIAKSAGKTFINTQNSRSLGFLLKFLNFTSENSPKSKCDRTFITYNNHTFTYTKYMTL